MTKVTIHFNGGAAVIVSDPELIPITLADTGVDLNISNTVTPPQLIASFAKTAVMYWTSDLACIS